MAGYEEVRMKSSRPTPHTLCAIPCTLARVQARTRVHMQMQAQAKNMQASTAAVTQKAND